MQGVAKRTARACERCRQLRRRCEPPYPCRQCAAAGVSCDVRAKARPQRRLPYKCTTPVLHNNNRDGGGLSSGTPGVLNNKQPESSVQSPRAIDHPVGRAQGDTFELLKALVQDMLLERHGKRPCAASKSTANGHRLRP